MALVYRTQQLTEIWANSGSAQDIQDAVDQAFLAGGGIVRVPEGTFLYPPEVFNKNTPFSGKKCAVIIPGGVSVIGAGMDKTILQMTDEIPDVFFFLLDGSNGKRIRVSGIKFKGRVTAEAVDYEHIRVYRATDFRIDHCFFEDFPSEAIYVANFWSYPNVRGVVDHCKFDEPYKDLLPNGGRWGYAVSVTGGWDSYVDDITTLLGKYDNIPNPKIPVVYVEDCESNKARYLATSNQGGWYVVRHCTIKNPRGHNNPPAGTDVHEGYPDTGMQGGLGCEFYNNFVVQDTPHPQGFSIVGVQLRAGGGVVYNNTIQGLSPTSPAQALVNLMLMSEACKADKKNHVHDLYIWNNTLINTQKVVMTTGNGFYQENVNYFLYEKPYTPYPYPHPLTLEEVPPAYVTPWTGELEEGTYKITMPQQVQVGSDIYNFKQWEDGSTNPTRTINLTSDMTITATYELAPLLTATIRGVVRDAETKKPIIGALVTCNGFSDVTEADGSYEFVDIPAKSYTLTVKKENYATATASVDASAGGIFTQDFELSPTPVIPPKIPPKIKVTGPLGIWTFPLLTRLAETFPSLATLLERLKSTQTAS
jgi:hypothetical protein